ncbi:MAG: proline--tRNA ligase [Acidimicrobiia bacterium]
MRMSQLFLRTLREDPADAEVVSHKLLVRAGYIRRIASGVYAWLPLGQRVLANVEDIVRREMEASGAQEVTLPILQPLDLWARTGRDTTYGPAMFRLSDRRDNHYCLAPTAEEVITTLVASEYSSHKDLPVNLYQFQWKFRDEFRPRFGLLRCREFLMKDGYSFDVDADGLRASYQVMYDSYTRIFDRCGLTTRPVEAQAGEIGGDINHEFMAVAAIGEDDFVRCTVCSYAANVEAATRQAPTAIAADASIPDVTVVHTPGTATIEAVCELLNITADETLKCICVDVDGALGLALVPGDREVNEFALSRAFGTPNVRLYEAEDFVANPGLPRGYVGPHHPDVKHLVADPSVRARASWVTGANNADHHAVNVALGRDFTPDAFVDIATVRTGDACPRCGSALSVDRGIEVGHVFQLGTKYSEKLDAVYLDDQGVRHPMYMGCYGVGVSRIVAAVAEEHHDEYGICWPHGLAPYEVHVVVLPGKSDAAAAVWAAADAFVAELGQAGIEALVDDRDVSPGVKFADADLIGMPLQVTIGAKGLAAGSVECKVRATGERRELPLAEAGSTIVAQVRAATRR